MGTAHTLSTKGIATLNYKTQKKKTHSLFLDLMSIMLRTIGTCVPLYKRQKSFFEFRMESTP